MPSVLRLLLQYEVDQEHRILGMNRYFTIRPTSYQNLLEIISSLYTQNSVETRSRRLYIKNRGNDVNEHYYNTGLYENDILICTIGFGQTARIGA